MSMGGNGAAVDNALYDEGVAGHSFEDFRIRDTEGDFEETVFERGDNAERPYIISVQNEMYGWGQFFFRVVAFLQFMWTLFTLACALRLAPS